MSQLQVSIPCKYCHRYTKNADAWCKVCLGPKSPEADRVTVSSSLGNKQVIRSSDNSNKKTPRPEQEEDKKLILEELYENNQDRVQIRAACGMGKTFTGQLVIDEISKKIADDRGDRGRFLVLCPTISLAQQLREDYQNDGLFDVDALSIHDESGDFDKNAKNKNDDEEEQIRKFFEEDNFCKPKILFAVSSPTSVGKIAKTQKEAGGSFDAAIFDEAHNLGGEVGSKTGSKKPSDRARIFFNEEEGGVNIDKRVFMTATPKSFEGSLAGSSKAKSNYETYIKAMGDNPENAFLYLDQSDERFFGRMVSSHSYAEAVQKGYLNPVRAVEKKSMIKTSGNIVNINRQGVVDIDTGTYKGDRQIEEKARDGRKKKLSDSEMSLGSYQSAVAIIDSLSDDEKGSSNTLSFSDSIEEAKQDCRQSEILACGSKLFQVS